MEKRYVVPELTVTVAGMDKTMSQRTREEVLEKMRRRYLSAGPKHKRKLLDQAQELLGYHRKSAIRTLRAPKVEPVPWINAGRPVSYEPGVFAALVAADLEGDRLRVWPAPGSDVAGVDPGLRG